jgi:hypothetical protein
MKTKIVSSYTADSKPVKQEVNGTVILPPLVFPALSIKAIRILGKQTKANFSNATAYWEKGFIELFSNH